MKVQVGDKIKIIEMQGEPQYSGKTGVVEYVDSVGHLHGTWGGCAIIPKLDTFKIVGEQNND